MADERAVLVHNGKRIQTLGEPIEYALGEGEDAPKQAHRMFRVQFEVVDPADGTEWVVNDIVMAHRKEVERV